MLDKDDDLIPDAPIDLDELLTVTSIAVVHADEELTLYYLVKSQSPPIP